MTVVQWVLVIVAGAYFGFGALIGLVAGLMNAWMGRDGDYSSAGGVLRAMHPLFSRDRGCSWCDSGKRRHWPRGAPRE